MVERLNHEPYGSTLVAEATGITVHVYKDKFRGYVKILVLYPRWGDQSIIKVPLYGRNEKRVWVNFDNIYLSEKDLQTYKKALEVALKVAQGAPLDQNLLS